MDASGWDGYGPVGGRLCVKNLSFGLSPKTLAQELRKIGFPYVKDDDVNVVRKGGVASTRFCTAFVPMESWSDVDTAIEMLNGRVVPSCSHKALRTERAIPRMKDIARTHGGFSEKEGAEDTSALEPEPDNETTDLGPGSSGAKAVAQLMEVKKEEKDYKNQKKSKKASGFTLQCGAII